MSTPSIVAIVGVVVAGGSVFGCLLKMNSMKRTHWLIAVPIIILGFAATIAGATIDTIQNNAAEREAIKTLEKTHGVKIQYVDEYVMGPRRWMVDGVWLDCYVTDRDYADAATADLMCETNHGDQPYERAGSR